MAAAAAAVDAHPHWDDLLDQSGLNAQARELLASFGITNPTEVRDSAPIKEFGQFWKDIAKTASGATPPAGQDKPLSHGCPGSSSMVCYSALNSVMLLISLRMMKISVLPTFKMLIFGSNE